ncbi:hypothetical protein HQ520_02805 [bacterium]|nr:hypothetical protein [bacterium]
MLDETAEDYEKLLAEEAARDAATRIEKEARDKLRTPITIATDMPVPLRDYRKSLEILSGVDIVVAQGGDALIDATFVDKPLSEVLDSVLEPIGLIWTREGDVITIRASLETRVFNLSTENMAKVASLMENGVLQRILWGEAGEPAFKDAVLQLEERQGVLLVVDSAQNVQKLESFLNELKKDMPQDIVTRIYTIRADTAEQTKALGEALLRTEETGTEAIDRQVILQGNTLVVKALRDEIEKVEELLVDPDINQGLESQELDVAVFVIVPREEVQEDPTLAATFFAQVKEVVETMLYAREGKEAARLKGRRTWWDDVDPTVKQMTIIDYPDRIQIVSDYLDSLGQLEQRLREEIVFLSYLDVEDDISDIRQLLGLEAAAATSSGGGDGLSQTFTLRTDGQVTFRDLRILLRRVNENDVNLDNDDSCTLVVNTPTTSQEITLDELGVANFVEDYRFYAEDVRPSGNNEGTARVQITYAPAELAAQAVEPEVVVAPEPTEEEDFELEAFGKQNALLVRYREPADLKRVRDLLDKLDVPERQVDIETLFVRVNEARAKEFSSQFSFLDRSDPRNYGQGWLGLVDGPNGGQMPVQGPTIADGITNNAVNGDFLTDFTNIDIVLDKILGNYVNMQLTLLEMEGVVSIHNGPHVVVLHGDTARFEIGYRVENNTSTNNTADDTNRGRIDNTVEMDVSPIITSPDSIILDELVVTIEEMPQNANGAVGFFATDADGRTKLPGTVHPNRMRKFIDTRARIKNGGTIVLGGWTGEFTEDLTSGVPGLRNLPWIGKLLFSRNRHSTQKTNLLIFLSGEIVE